MADRFFKLIRDLHVGVVVQGPDTGVLVCNPAALELLGLDEDQYQGKTSYDPGWNIVREDGRPFEAAERPVATVLATGKAVRDVVMGVYRPKTKDRVWLLVNAEPELDEAGRLLQVVATLFDITERKRLESSLLEARKLESVGRLAGGIAHDFNNLLTVIMGATSGALQRVPAGAAGHDDLVAALDAAERATGLTRQLLAFARQRVVSTEVTRVADEVRAMVPLLQRVVGAAVTVAVDADEVTWATQMAPVELEQVLVNLCANARDAMPKGGALGLRTRNVVVDADGQRVPRGEYVCLSLSDSGQGMSAQTRERIFEPFFTTKPEGQGTGLGLATVHGIVQQHKGHVAVDSTPGQGTTFSIYLPRVADSRVVSAAARSGAQGGQETILLVDDTPAVLKLARRALESFGYTVLDAVDGVDALRVATAHQGAIDLLFTDLRMPNMGGYQLAEALCSQRPAMRVLITSGFSEEVPLRPEWHFLVKPYTPSQLSGRVREVLGRPATL